MGVAGAGKTSVARQVAAARGLSLIEGDDLHPPGNIAKSSAGVPLTDEDRWPWLDAIAARIAAEPADEAVATCSALRRAYRDRLRRGAGRPLVFLFLHGSPDLLAERIAARIEHFAPPRLLQSQLATLEEPLDEPDVLRVAIDGPIAAVVARATASLAEEPGTPPPTGGAIASPPRRR